MHFVEIGRLERGTRDLRISTLAKVARGLKVPASKLVKGI
jgi:transcriptional regulator with XRE-family HTH domain